MEKVSSIYRSKPYGFEDQPDFLNAAAEVTTELDPQSLLAKLQVIETDLGKEILRENGPRAIDLDLLFYGDLVLKTEELEIPHPGIPERDFVLLPLAELAPDFIHPVKNQKIGQLVAELKTSYLDGSVASWK